MSQKSAAAKLARQFFMLPIMLLLMLTTQMLDAQTPGYIIRDGNGAIPPAAYSPTLDPNQNGYSSTSAGGFSGSDIGVGNSEIPYYPVPLVYGEPVSDLRRGPDGRFSEIVYDGTDRGFYLYFDGTNMLMRMRIGGIMPGSKGYSVLLDVDQKFGASGPNADPTYQAQSSGTNGNPGFEFEIVYETNFDIAVYFIDNSCPTAPIKIKSYTLSATPQYAQTSIALTTVTGDPDYFYDFYVPLSDLNYGGFAVTSSTPLRVSCTTVMSPQGAICGPKSDIYGNDDLFKSTNAQYEAEVLAQDPFTLTDIGSGGSGIGATCTAPPSVNSPIASTATSISGTWTKASYSTNSTATITVYKNGVSIGTVSATSGSAWTLSSITVSPSDVITAKAKAIGESDCEVSNRVTVQGCLPANTTVCPTVTCATAKGMEGTGIAGATLKIYQLLTSGQTQVFTVTIPAGGAWGWAGIGSTGNANNVCGTGTADVPNGTYLITQQESGKCESAGCATNCVNGTATATPVITQTTIYNSSVTLSGTAVSGATVYLYVNNILKTTATATGGNFSFTLTSYNLNQGDVVSVNALSTTASSCFSATVSRTVACFTSPPIITTNDAGQVVIGALLTGTSSEAAGTTVTIKRFSDNATIGTATVLSDGTWTLASPAVAASTTYYATQSTACGASAISGLASSLGVTASGCGSITAPVAENASSVSGTGFGNGGTVKLFIDGQQIGSATTSGTGTWTISSLAVNTVYANGVLSTTYESGGLIPITCPNTVTVSCTPPSSSYTIAVSPATSGTGATVGSPYIVVSSPLSFTVSGTTTGVLYTLENASGVDQAGSVFGSNGNTVSINNVTVPTTPGSSYTWQLKATKLSGTCTESYVYIYFTVDIPPVATNNSTSTNEDVAVTINALTAGTPDSDADGTIDAASVDLDPSTAGQQTSITTAAGSWSVDATGIVTYTPALNFNGNATLDYTVKDNQGAVSNVATITITVDPVNDPPVATNNSISSNEDTPVSLNVVTGGTPDSDVDGTVNAATVDLDPSTPGIQTTITTAEGDWSVDASGNVTFSPVTNFNGPATIPYTVNDNSGAVSNTANITITINSINDAPGATDNSGSTTGTTPVTLNAVTDGTPDSDPDGTIDVSTVDLDPSTAGQQTTASTAAGEWSVDNAGNVTFTPNNGFSGTATIPYAVKDNDGLTSNTATISINVKIPPVATNNSSSSTGTTPVTLNVVADGTADSDADGTVDASTVDLDPSTAGQQTAASTADGEWSVDGSGNVTFTANPGFSGSATLTYTVKDNDGLTSNTATISIDVNVPPVATNNSSSTTGTTPVTLNMVTDGTADSDADGTVDASTVDLDPSTAGQQTAASTADGEWSVDGSGNVTFTANPGFSGSATLTYTVKDNDGLTSNVANISIDVNVPPVATDNSSATNQNTPVTFNVVTDGTVDSDADGTVDASTVDLDPSTAGQQTTASTADGEWSVDASGNVTFSPAPNYSGDAYLSYTVLDNDGLTSNTATIKVVVTKVCTLIATAVSNKTGCFGSTDGTVSAIVSGGSGSYSYLWSNGATTKEVFSLSKGKYTVTVTDINTGCTSNSEVCVLAPSKIRMELAISKPAPGVKCGTSASAYSTKGVAPYTYLWNDGVTTSSRTGLCQGKYRVTVTDANGCTASEQFTLGPCRIYINTITKKDATCGGAADGVFSMQATGAAAPYTYTWPDGYIGSYRTGLAAGNYNVTVIDATGCTVVFAAEIGENCDVCTSIANGPVAKNDEFSVNQNAVVAGNVSVNDIPTNSLNVWSRISNPAYGTAVFQPNGSFSYTPNTGFTGTDVFTYELCDNGGNCTEAVATITVNSSTCNLTASLVTVNPTCNKLSGSLAAVVNGGSGSYSYTWSNGSSAASASGLTEGNYTVVITDDVSGCKTSAIGCITNPELLKARITITNNGNSCTTGVTVTPTKGTAPFTYYWNDGSTAQSRTNLCAGPYNVRVTDSKGCVFQKQFTIGECSININVLALVNATCTQPNSGRINVSATGGTGPYTYTWLDGATGPLRTGLAAGNYSGTVMDATGCTTPISFEIKNDCDPCSRRNAKLGINTLIPSTSSTSSVTTQFSALSLKAMPNPANGRTTITIQSNKSTTGTLSLVDINGKVFSNQTIAINAGVNTIKMNFMGAAQGVYLVRLVTEGATQSIKLIVE